METKRCIFCMQEMNTEERKCPACGKGPWQYHWKPGWISPYTRLHDRYLIGVSLGEGAFGVTYLAWDEKTGERVAIKAYKKETPGREVEPDRQHSQLHAVVDGSMGSGQRQRPERAGLSSTTGQCGGPNGQ